MIGTLTKLVMATALYLLIGLLVPGYADDTGSSSIPEFNEFKIIVDRNIFDPERTPSSRRSGSEKATQRPPSGESLSLFGVLIHNGGSMAFFEGSKPEYKRVLKSGETIIGYKITWIATDKVTLENHLRRIVLPVGSSLAREDGGDWKLGAKLAYGQESRHRNNNAETGKASSTIKNDTTNELIKQLMERRRRETEK